jgi:hypothetical protein
MNGYLFYSEGCKYCTHLRNVMINQNIIRIFNECCIDNMTPDELIKLGLTSVPTIVIVSTNNQTGRHSKGIYENEAAFKYIEDIISNRRKNTILRAENDRKIIQINNMKRNARDGLYEYKKMEAEGISDLYSYWNNDMTKEIDESQPKSFLPHGKEKEYGIMTIPETKDEIQKNKLKESDLTKMINNIQTMRDGQDAHLKEIMNKEQIDKIMQIDMSFINT